ncbi:PPE domain-containing protein [Tsukamurella hominis]|uniref:PPE domain-containing protein n=1 Tax=Tsukamurella hominis TaxID=1970232 RepID=UPI0039E95935
MSKDLFVDTSSVAQSGVQAAAAGAEVGAVGASAGAAVVSPPGADTTSVSRAANVAAALASAGWSTTNGAAAITATGQKVTSAAGSYEAAEAGNLSLLSGGSSGSAQAVPAVLSTAPTNAAPAPPTAAAPASGPAGSGELFVLSLHAGDRGAGLRAAASRAQAHAAALDEQSGASQGRGSAVAASWQSSSADRAVSTVGQETLWLRQQSEHFTSIATAASRAATSYEEAVSSAPKPQEFTTARQKLQQAISANAASGGLYTARIAEAQRELVELETKARTAEAQYVAASVPDISVPPTAPGGQPTMQNVDFDKPAPDGSGDTPVSDGGAPAATVAGAGGAADAATATTTGTGSAADGAGSADAAVTPELDAKMQEVAQQLGQLPDPSTTGGLGDASQVDPSQALGMITGIGGGLMSAFGGLASGTVGGAVSAATGAAGAVTQFAGQVMNDKKVEDIGAGVDDAGLGTDPSGVDGGGGGGGGDVGGGGGGAGDGGGTEAPGGESPANTAEVGSGSVAFGTPVSRAVAATSPSSMGMFNPAMMAAPMMGAAGLAGAGQGAGAAGKETGREHKVAVVAREGTERVRGEVIRRRRAARPASAGDGEAKE